MRYDHALVVWRFFALYKFNNQSVNKKKPLPIRTEYKEKVIEKLKLVLHNFVAQFSLTSIL
jgi:hypothetical protein